MCANISKLISFVDEKRECQCDPETTDFHKVARTLRPDPNFYEEGVFCLF